MSYKVHNVKFYGIEPKAGQCMAYSRSRKLLAVSRQDNSIEIWNFASPNSPLLERCIPAQATEGSVEALAFAGSVHRQDEDVSDSEDEENDAPKKSPKKKKNKPRPLEDGRLFSTGLHGLVIEHDLDHVDCGQDLRRHRQRVWAVTSGPAWCMKFNRKCGKLAVGTEEGFVCLYDVVEDGLSYDKVLDKQEGRIFCLDWHTEGHRIVTGSTDTLRMWDAKTGHPLARMSTGRTEKHRETVVWSVLLLDNCTVVSGDSRGKTSFWNGKTGTLMDAYQTHRADVLSVAVNDKQNEVYSSGVDPVVFHFNPVAPNGPLEKHFNNKNKNIGAKQQQQLKEPNQQQQQGKSLPKWIKSVHRFSHTHDVRSILPVGRKVLSIGVDANLTVFDVPSKSLTKYPPLPPHGTNVVLSPAAGIISFKHSDSIQVWKLGESQQQSTASSTQSILPLMEEPVKLLTLKTGGQQEASVKIANFDVTSDGSRLAQVTTEGKIRIFQLAFDAGDLPAVQKMAFKPSVNSNNLSRFNHVKFCGNGGGKLLASTVGGTLVCFDLENSAVCWSMDSQQLGLSTGIKSIQVDNKADDGGGGSQCLVMDFSNNLLLLIGLTTTPPSLQRLPKHDYAPISAAAFDPHDKTVVVVYSNHQLMEYSPVTKAVTEFSKMVASKRTCPLPPAYLTKKFATEGILCPKKGTLIFYDIENVCSLEKGDVIKHAAENSSQPPASKTQKGDKNQAISSSHETTSQVGGKSVMRVTKKYQHLLHLGCMDNEGELVAVEDTPQGIEARLPPGLRQKKFGAM